MIHLARVQLLGSVGAPTKYLCKYPTPEDVFISVHMAKEDPFDKNSRQKYELFLDGDAVVIRHPLNPESEERVHVSRCKQWTPLPKRLVPVSKP